MPLVQSHLFKSLHPTRPTLWLIFDWAAGHFCSDTQEDAELEVEFGGKCRSFVGGDKKNNFSHLPPTSFVNDYL